MRKLFENFQIFHFQKRIVSAETIRGNTVSLYELRYGLFFKGTYLCGNVTYQVFSSLNCICINHEMETKNRFDPIGLLIVLPTGSLIAKSACLLATFERQLLLKGNISCNILTSNTSKNDGSCQSLLERKKKFAKL